MRRRHPAYAFGVSGIQKAPWRPNQTEAREDALDAGFGHRERDRDTIYLHPLADIYFTRDLVPVLPRAATEVPKNGPTSEPPPSRIERIIARREAQERATY